MDTTGNENEKAKKYAEWKCRKKVCQLSGCISSNGGITKCSELYNALQECLRIEKENFQLTIKKNII